MILWRKVPHFLLLHWMPFGSVLPHLQSTIQLTRYLSRVFQMRSESLCRLPVYKPCHSWGKVLFPYAPFLHVSRWRAKMLFWVCETLVSWLKRKKFFFIFHSTNALSFRLKSLEVKSSSWHEILSAITSHERWQSRPSISAGDVFLCWSWSGWLLHIGCYLLTRSCLNTSCFIELK